MALATHTPCDAATVGPRTAIRPPEPRCLTTAPEIGIVGAAAAVANAVHHAAGVRHRDLPIRPDKVLLGADPTSR